MPFRDNTILGHFSCWLVRQSLKKNSAIDQNQLSVSTLKKKNVKKIKQTMCYGRNWNIVIRILQSKILVNGIKKRIIRLSLTGWYITTNILGKLVATFLTVSWAAFFGMAQDKRVNPKSGQVVITEEEIHDQLLSTLASLSVDGIGLFLG